MLTNKLDKVVNRSLKEKAFFRIESFGIREDYLTERLDILISNKRQSTLVGFFGHWR
jgi:hypothetical protein